MYLVQAGAMNDRQVIFVVVLIFLVIVSFLICFEMSTGRAVDSSFGDGMDLERVAPFPVDRLRV
jgi:hypothetical protein